MSKFSEPITVREFVNTLISCLLPIRIIRISDTDPVGMVWMGTKNDIDECIYADSKIFTGDDGTICGIYLDHLTIWIEE